jgi:23S rRNA pseudouridine2457 synthase
MTAETKHIYIKLNKPYGMLSQFTQEKEGDVTLATLDIPFRDVYPVGRLDKDSEGLLLLTNNPSVNKPLLHPTMSHERTYWIQVEGIITTQALLKLSHGGLDIQGYKTLPARAKVIHPSDNELWERVPPIRERKNIPTSWLSLTLTEGKNRQVRKMTALVGFPTLRLIRYAIEGLTVSDLSASEYILMDEKEFFTQLKLKK